MNGAKLLIITLILIVSTLVENNAALGDDANNGIFQKKSDPLIAIWCDNIGRMPSDAPYLRVAIWEDGQVIFAKDPEKWEYSLQEGKIASYRIKLLKKALLDTNVFELKGNTYLVPDAPTYSITINIGDKKQTLYWDEVETSGYGINIKPKPQHVEFKKCWKSLNSLALVACPDEFVESKEKFSMPPQSWYAKPAIQSE
jgi:hypothetical protein